MKAGITEGKGFLLLYQARARKAWYDEPKLPISSISPGSITMNAYRKEVRQA
jgi:hypothetical protein